MTDKFTLFTTIRGSVLRQTTNHIFTILLGARAMKLASFAEWRQRIVEYRKILYNGEFDPGSGWTLATGLTHASRGETI